GQHVADQVPIPQLLWQGFAQLCETIIIGIGAGRSGLMNDLRHFQNVRQHRLNPLVDSAGSARATRYEKQRQFITHSKYFQSARFVTILERASHRVSSDNHILVHRPCDLRRGLVAACELIHEPAGDLVADADLSGLFMRQYRRTSMARNYSRHTYTATG